MATLKVIMEEGLKQTPYCYFVDLKQTFDIVSWSELWNKIVQIDLPLENWGKP